MASLVADCDSEVDVQLLADTRRVKPWSAAAVGVSAGLLMCGAAAAHFSGAATTVSTGHIQEEFQVIASPGRQLCASWHENCYDKGCCNVEGFNCFETVGEGQAKCMKDCDPASGFKCVQPQHVMEKVLEEAILVPGQKLYCFGVVTVETGNSELESHELDLMNYASDRGMSIFGCEENAIFSDGDIKLSNGRPFTRVSDGDGDWHFAKRKETGCWVNTGLFSQVWKAIQAEGKWQNADWVVKADPDAVFVPARLRQRLSSTFEVPRGSYLTNCPYVDYGFFGNLEVFSMTAFGTLLTNIDSCKAEINWKVGIQNGKYGPMGEDLFAQICLDTHSVRRVAAFDMTQDGACENKRDPDEKKNKKWQPHCEWAYGSSLHPFKEVDAWAQCMDKTMAAYPEPL